MDNARKNADDLKEQLSYITVHDGFKNASIYELYDIKETIAILVNNAS